MPSSSLQPNLHQIPRPEQGSYINRCPCHLGFPQTLSRYSRNTQLALLRNDTAMKRNDVEDALLRLCGLESGEGHCQWLVDSAIRIKILILVFLDTCATRTDQFGGA